VEDLVRRGMKVLVTGASGFIGRNLREGLSREFEVHAPVHAELELLDTAAVERFLRSRASTWWSTAPPGPGTGR
jgi:dTDP-4-dehydrorhamnose reductase